MTFDHVSSYLPPLMVTDKFVVRSGPKVRAQMLWSRVSNEHDDSFGQLRAVQEFCSNREVGTSEEATTIASRSAGSRAASCAPPHCLGHQEVIPAELTDISGRLSCPQHLQRSQPDSPSCTMCHQRSVSANQSLEESRYRRAPALVHRLFHQHARRIAIPIESRNGLSRVKCTDPWRERLAPNSVSLDMPGCCNSACAALLPYD